MKKSYESLSTFRNLNEIIIFCNIEDLRNLELTSKSIRMVILNNPLIYGRSIINKWFNIKYKEKL